MESYRILRCLTAPRHSADSEKAELLGQVDRAWIFIRGTRVGDSSSYVLFISTYLKPYEYDINTYAYDMYTWARKAAKGQHMLTSFNGSRPATEHDLHTHLLRNIFANSDVERIVRAKTLQ